MKRTSDRQLTKDTASSDEDDARAFAEGFDKASPEAMAKRRVLKARRTPAAALAASASAPHRNPFAALAVPAPQSEPASAVAPAAPPAKADASAGTAAVAPAPPSAPSADGTAATSAVPAAAAVLPLAQTEPSDAPGADPATAPSAEPAAVASAKPASMPNAESVAVQNGEPGSAPNSTPAAAQNTESGATPAAVPTADPAAAPSVEPVVTPATAPSAEPATAPDSSLITAPPAVADAATDAAPDAEQSALPGATPAQNTTAPTKATAPPTVPTPPSAANGEPRKPAFSFGGGYGSAPAFTFANAAGTEQTNNFSFKVPAFTDAERAAPVAAATVPQVAPPPKFAETEVKTGEEDERELFRARAKVYSLVPGAGDVAPRWKERGVGPLKLNIHRTTKKVRILMRTEATLRVVVNTRVFPELTFDRASERSLRFQGMDVDSADGTARTSFLLRFATRDDANSILAALDKWRESVRENS